VREHEVTVAQLLERHAPAGADAVGAFAPRFGFVPRFLYLRGRSRTHLPPYGLSEVHALNPERSYGSDG
jgi:hypothetical protein